MEHILEADGSDSGHGAHGASHQYNSLRPSSRRASAQKRHSTAVRPPGCGRICRRHLPLAGPARAAAFRERALLVMAQPRTGGRSPRTGTSVPYKYKDYRIEGPGRYKTMTLEAHEFIRRFLIHVLPKGFHRIRLKSRTITGLRSKCTFTLPFAPLFVKTVKFTLTMLMAGVTCDNLPHRTMAYSGEQSGTY
jgi:Putative transposase